MIRLCNCAFVERLNKGVIGFFKATNRAIEACCTACRISHNQTANRPISQPQNTRQNTGGWLLLCIGVFGNNSLIKQDFSKSYNAPLT
jgi:hypothetical protein